MFLLLFVGFLAAGWIHALATGPRTRRRFAELLLVYCLVGYFGLVMLATAVFTLAAPEHSAASHGWRVSADNPFQQFAGVAFGAMALAAILAVWLRGLYLVGPAVCWALIFLGATWIHLADPSARGQAMTFHRVLHVFGSHGLMSVVLIVLLVAYMSPERANRPE